MAATTGNFERDCRFGLQCTRRNCLFKHPERPRAPTHTISPTKHLADGSTDIELAFFDAGNGPVVVKMGMCDLSLPGHVSRRLRGKNAIFIGADFEGASREGHVLGRMLKGIGVNTAAPCTMATDFVGTVDLPASASVLGVVVTTVRSPAEADEIALAFQALRDFDFGAFDHPDLHVYLPLFGSRAGAVSPVVVLTEVVGLANDLAAKYRHIKGVTVLTNRDESLRLCKGEEMKAVLDLTNMASIGKAASALEQAALSLEPTDSHQKKLQKSIYAFVNFHRLYSCKRIDEFMYTIAVVPLARGILECVVKHECLKHGIAVQLRLVDTIKILTRNRQYPVEIVNAMHVTRVGGNTALHRLEMNISDAHAVLLALKTLLNFLGVEGDAPPTCAQCQANGGLCRTCAEQILATEPPPETVNGQENCVMCSDCGGLCEACAAIILA